MIEDILLLMKFGTALDRRVPHRVGDGVEEWSVRELMIQGLLKIRSKDKKLELMRQNRAQREYAARCGKRNIVLKARQLGMTTYIAARYFIQTITQPGTLTVQVAHTQESAEAIFNIVHRFWENLPKQMQKGALIRSRASSRQIVFPRLDSEYRVATAADQNAGRGMTIHNLHCSEVARWPRDGEETLASLRSAVPEDGEIVLESTPNGTGGVFYEEWQRAEETGYVRHFFPWWYEERYRVGMEPQRTPRVTEEDTEDGKDSLPTLSQKAREGWGNPGTGEGARASINLSPEEEELVRRFGLDEEQIAWRRASWSRLRGMAAQEFAEDAVSCFRASGECVFELEAIEKAAEHCRNPYEAKENGRWQTWLPAQEGKKYVIGVDPAGGGSEGDYACAQVIERKTAMQCAELHGHYSPRELAARVMEMGRIYKDALIVVERNNHGFGVLAHLRGMECGNVYREGEQDGWLTSAVSRPAMIEGLAAALAESPELFVSERLLNECRTFVRHPDGSSAAMAGAHDDCVMAMAIALAAREKVAGRIG